MQSVALPSTLSFRQMATISFEETINRCLGHYCNGTIEVIKTELIMEMSGGYFRLQHHFELQRQVHRNIVVLINSIH